MKVSECTERKMTKKKEEKKVINVACHCIFNENETTIPVICHFYHIQKGSFKTGLHYILFCPFSFLLKIRENSTIKSYSNLMKGFSLLRRIKSDETRGTLESFAWGSAKNFVINSCTK